MTDPIDILTGVSDDAKNLAVHMQTVLDKVVETYAAYNMPLPERRYWTMGEAAVDCEQVAVTFLQSYIGLPGDEATRPTPCNSPRSAVLNIQVSRTVPSAQRNGKPPLAADIEAHAEISAYDAWILMESLSALDTWGVTGGPGMGVIATVDAPAPSGGFQVVSLTMTSVVP
jgi:hypothetical protein